jgi:hypothetical protein
MPKKTKVSGEVLQLAMEAAEKAKTSDLTKCLSSSSGAVSKMCSATKVAQDTGSITRCEIFRNCL